MSEIAVILIFKEMVKICSQFESKITKSSAIFVNYKSVSNRKIVSERLSHNSERNSYLSIYFHVSIIFLIPKLFNSMYIVYMYDIVYIII